MTKKRKANSRRSKWLPKLLVLPLMDLPRDLPGEAGDDQQDKLKQKLVKKGLSPHEIEQKLDQLTKKHSDRSSFMQELNTWLKNRLNRK